MLLTETWLNSLIDDTEILPCLPDFDIFRKDRDNNQRGGGVLVATKRDLRCVRINITSPLEIVWLCCHASHPRILIGVCYRAPSTDTSFARLFHENLNQLRTTHPNSPILLFGDFNFPSINWSDTASMSSKNTPPGEFINTCLTFGLSQLVTQPTRVTDHSSNILDLVLTSHPENVSPITYLRGLSDHLVVHASFSCSLHTSKKTRKTLTLYDKGDYDSMNRDLSTFFENFAVSFAQRSLESNWLLFKSEMQRLIRLYIPTKTISERPSSPWFNTSLKRLNNKKKRLFRAAKNSNTSQAWQKYYAAENDYKTSTAHAKQSFFSVTLPSMLRTEPKRFWKTINPSASNCVSLCDSSGLPTPDREVPDILNNAFSAVFTREPLNDLPTVPSYDHPPMPSIMFEPQGIVKVIDSLKNSSSVGIDGINAKVLKKHQTHEQLVSLTHFSTVSEHRIGSL